MHRDTSLPHWLAWWERLSPDRQKELRGWAYSFCFQLSLLLLLCLFTIGVPGANAIDLTLSFAEPKSLDDAPSITIEPIEEPASNVEPESVSEAEVEMEPPPVELTDSTAPAKDVAEPASDATDITSLTSNSDRITETNRRVAAAGGNIRVPVRISLSFSGDDDIDLHVKFKGQHRQADYHGRADGYIWHRYPNSLWGKLDVDANRRGGPVAEHPCENVAFAFPPHEARYSVELEHFHVRDTPDITPYIVVVQSGAKTAVHTGTIQPGERLTICQFQYQHSNVYGKSYAHGRSTAPVYK